VAARWRYPPRRTAAIIITAVQDVSLSKELAAK
jgi:hypothetical protein